MTSKATKATINSMKLELMNDEQLLTIKEAFKEQLDNHVAAWKNAPEGHRIKMFNYGINPYFVEIISSIDDELKKRNLFNA